MRVRESSRSGLGGGTLVPARPSGENGNTGTVAETQSVGIVVTFRSLTSQPRPDTVRTMITEGAQQAPPFAQLCYEAYLPERPYRPALRGDKPGHTYLPTCWVKRGAKIDISDLYLGTISPKSAGRPEVVIWVAGYV